MTARETVTDYVRRVDPVIAALAHYTKQLAELLTENGA